jgi:hypothetical protein
LCYFLDIAKPGYKRKGLRMMMIEITLPLVGTFTAHLALVGLVISWVFLAVLAVAIHLDNKKEGNY